MVEATAAKFAEEARVRERAAALEIEALRSKLVESEEAVAELTAEASELRVGREAAVASLRAESAAAEARLRSEASSLAAAKASLGSEAEGLREELAEARATMSKTSAELRRVERERDEEARARKDQVLPLYASPAHLAGLFPPFRCLSFIYHTIFPLSSTYFISLSIFSQI
jgi:regulator of replication initiation timing